MNYNTVFAPAAAAERFIKALAANLPAYGLIVSTITLTGIQTAFDFAIEHLDRRDEYVIRIKLAKVRAIRSVVQRAIAAERFRLNVIADFRALSDRTAKRRRIAAANVRSIGVSVSRFMDALFCLG